MSSFLKKLAPIALGIAAPYAAPALGISKLVAGVGAGALGGAIGGRGLKGALLGGLQGGLGSIASGAGSALAGSGSNAASQGSNVLGAAAKTSSSGLGSALSKALGGISNITSGNTGTLLSGLQAYKAQSDAEKKLKQAQMQSQEALQPFLGAGQQGLSALQSGFDPSQLTSDAGYQFRVQQGNQALERSLAAKGMGDSGAALKAAQDYGQGLASQSYNDAYNQWLQKNSGLANYGQSATGNLLGTYNNMGDIGANAAIAKSNIISGSLYNALSGNNQSYVDASGNQVYNNKRITGYDPKTGQPIYG